MVDLKRLESLIQEEGRLRELAREDEFKFDELRVVGYRLNAAFRDAAHKLIKMARRYQWVREHPVWESEAFLLCLTPEQYDIEVDKAMASDSAQSQEESR